VGERGGSFSREGSRKLIKPDLLAMSQLLNFDEVIIDFYLTISFNLILYVH